MKDRYLDCEVNMSLPSHAQVLGQPFSICRMQNASPSDHQNNSKKDEQHVSEKHDYTDSGHYTMI